jgi:dipeptidyl-peptidase-4
VLHYNYGGPHAQTVRNTWGGSRHLWFRYLAQEGFVVWMCDNRSASGKGIAPTWEAHGRMGELELADLESCLAWLKGQAWVDASRIGVYGGSYGGFMASFALTHSKSFKAGIAFAPVTDWRLYDSIYTERYMGRPQDNAEGYDATSVIEAADRLHGALLLIHGTMDDNVHLQNTIQLANALQQAGKDFQLMLYPNSRHGIRDKRQIYHLHRSMTRFLKENL